MGKKISTDQRRRYRVRRRLQKVANGRARLSVFRSSKHIYAQIIDGSQTVASASSRDKGFSEAKGTNKMAASEVGKMIAKSAKAAGVTEVVFDRGSYLYHGRIRALAEAARETGLKF